MKNEIFRKVVGTKTYQTTAHGTIKESRVGNTEYKWDNSNKLLGKMNGLLGCKTGITDAAGPCFGGYYECKKKEGMKLAIVLCHAKSLDHRWVEIEALVDWTK
jgi:D-alanyl-D-alanine carboxypeptidase